MKVFCRRQTVIKSNLRLCGVKQLAELLECEHIVAFGDGVNDVDMFKLADECYAVENATNILKQVATKTIDKNTANGVPPATA